MKKIYKATLPKDSLIKELRYDDFSDSLGMRLDRTDIDINDVVNCFFTAAPGFVTHLMKLRDLIVGSLGLKTGDYTKREKVIFEQGKDMGLFKMFEKNGHEAIIGADDKHLNFRVSLYVNSEINTTEILISTVVLFNNRWGKFYMGIVSPFHKVVVKSMIKHMQKSLTALPKKSRSQEM
jgi:hypothetical protein